MMTKPRFLQGRGRCIRQLLHAPRDGAGYDAGRLPLTHWEAGMQSVVLDILLIERTSTVARCSGLLRCLWPG